MELKLDSQTAGKNGPRGLRQNGIGRIHSQAAVFAVPVSEIGRASS
jgi:hypothetical protein